MSLLSTALEQGLSPDIIDDTNPDDIFVGYLKYDFVKTPNFCMIKRIKKTLINGELVTAIRYPNGRADFVFDWAARAGYTYRFNDSPLINTTA
jgi:hypothetical protein